MDRFLENQNTESIRQTILAQDDMFKQQVRELHRVYNTQKMMMNQLKHRSQYRTVNSADQTQQANSGINLENMVSTTQKTTDHIEESELELTLSIGLSSSSSSMKTTNKDYSSTMSFSGSGPNTPMSSSSTTLLDREKKKSHWLFQGLSINRTSS